MFSVQCSLSHAVFAKNKRIYNINDDDDIRISFHSFSSVSFYLPPFFLFPFVYGGGRVRVRRFLCARKGCTLRTGLAGTHLQTCVYLLVHP